MSFLDEFFTHTRNLRMAEINWLLGQGVTPLALAKDPGEIGFVIGAAKVVFNANHFDFAKHDADLDVSALVMVARDEAGDVADLVAWRPKDQIVAPYACSVSMLGQHNIERPRLGEPLLVHSDPLHWLRADRQGVVVLNPQRAWSLLFDAGELQAANVEHGLSHAFGRLARVA